jgi:CubicO group peptidase (beta-lactamase class C family)
VHAIDAYVESARRDWRVPGLAVAVVRDGAVILARGYGVRRLGAPDTVDAHTRFAAGSITKAFTAALLGTLVDERRLAWDDPVTRHLPDFQLLDPADTRAATVRDLLAHRTGVPRTDLVWVGGSLSRAELVRRLRFTAPVAGLNRPFVYNNVNYVAAGEIVRALTGRSWDEALRERLLVPLGMDGTTTSIRTRARPDGAPRGRPNVAEPHAWIRDEVRAIPYRDVDNMAAAGGLNSSAADLARWLQFVLDSGRVGGRPLLAPATFAALVRPQVLVPLGAAERRANPHRHLRAYAMGWYVESYRGREVVHHGGAQDGMTALVALMPEERLGVVVLANLQGTSLPMALAYRIFDAHLGAPPTDWSGRLLADWRRGVAAGRAFEAREDSARVPGTRPTLPLAAYVGTYADSAYGPVHVSIEGDRLTATSAQGFRGSLEHWHYDTFRTRWDGVLQEGHSYATFGLDAAGRPAQLTLDLVGPVVLGRVAPGR